MHHLTVERRARAVAVGFGLGYSQTAAQRLGEARTLRLPMGRRRILSPAAIVLRISGVSFRSSRHLPERRPEICKRPDMIGLSRVLRLNLLGICFAVGAHAASGQTEAAGAAPVKSKVDAASVNACLRHATVTCAETAPTAATASTAAKGQLSPVSTAFAVDDTGDFLTNNHVVSGCAGMQIRIAGEWQDAEVTARDERNDLALLRAHSRVALPALVFRDGSGIRPADAVIVIGFPYAGLLTNDPQVTTGVVSALSGLRDDKRYVELTAPVQPGSSGGPLLDLSGNVVGVVTAKLNKFAAANWTGLPEWLGTLPENVNFALKSDNVRGFLDANGIRYKTASSTVKRDAADVGELASKSVTMVDCR